MDTTVGIRFRVWTDFARHAGSTLAEWKALPLNGWLLCDVDEPLQYAPGQHYRWRMQSDWFGCRETEDGRLEFCRYDGDRFPAGGWNWHQGLLVSDKLMAAITAEANVRE